MIKLTKIFTIKLLGKIFFDFEIFFSSLKNILLILTIFDHNRPNEKIIEINLGSAKINIINDTSNFYFGLRNMKNHFMSLEKSRKIFTRYYLFLFKLGLKTLLSLIDSAVVRNEQKLKKGSLLILCSRSVLIKHRLLVHSTLPSLHTHSLHGNGQKWLLNLADFFGIRTAIAGIRSFAKNVTVASGIVVYHVAIVISLRATRVQVVQVDEFTTSATIELILAIAMFEIA
ncbi:hypothetical protein BpHYR1_017636 [Brachionus plicatilis]|uniref:Uncharacterized protein n=1 Tax=Brachionus plicatilis TaxID=10195 RepID=A0A3M7SDS7_BRAPC|nr:hypothetical protein BpHYR1_017636 [Brachionus plicatilis]